MKLLHTSDWHLGQILYGYDRLDENKHFLRQIKAIAKEEQPDIFLLCGDIFDVSNPSATVFKLFNDFIMELREALPEMQIVAISGNHDSAARIEASRRIWQGVGAHIIGRTVREGKKFNFSENVINIPGKAVVGAAPFLHSAFMIFDDKDVTPEKQFFRQLNEEVSKNNVENLPVILMAHLAVTGSEGDKKIRGISGTLSAVEQDVFGTEVDYVALGHIHRARATGGDGKIRYSGSPIAMGFDETHEHSVTIVEFRGKELESIKEVPLIPSRPLLTVPAEPKDFQTALKELSKLGKGENAYIRLNVAQTEDLPPDCEERVSALAREKGLRYCHIKFTKISDQSVKEGFRSMRAEEFCDISPEEIAAGFFKEIGFAEEKVGEFTRMIAELTLESENELTEMI